MNCKQETTTKDSQPCAHPNYMYVFAVGHHFLKELHIHIVKKPHNIGLDLLN